MSGVYFVANSELPVDMRCLNTIWLEIRDSRLGYSRKNPKKGGEGGVEDMEFPGALEKEHVEIPGVK